ncbi:MAG: E3 ubiquitin-protein ligase rad18 [Thelocarpon impressellum]|nr:MAG: E3 ubiquitin-protein ligase rad18 [Thelocarpon impressellum]
MDDIPDSTDWLATPLAALAPLEAALRCQVCKDFFTTPMLTSCAHTFCSLCIRRCVAADGKCPACRAPEQEVRLRRNGALEEVVDAWVKAREGVLGFARGGKKRRREDDAEGPARKTRSQSRRDGDSPPEPVVVDAASDGEYVADDGLVPCPLCNTRMKETLVYSHLDHCKGPPAPAPLEKKAARLPSLNYTLTPLPALRKKLADLHLRSSGPKPLLEKRHTEWVAVWNANCDAPAARRRSRKELLQEMEAWERSFGEGGKGAANGVMKKDFDGPAWAKRHGGDFGRLVEEARRARGKGGGGAREESGEQAAAPEPPPIDGEDVIDDSDADMGSDPPPAEATAATLAAPRRDPQPASPRATAMPVSAAAARFLPSPSAAARTRPAVFADDAGAADAEANDPIVVDGSPSPGLGAAVEGG